MRHARHIDTAIGSATLRTDRLSAAAAAAVAALFGFFIVYGVGFAAVPAVHNAAHDARHSLGFPCH